MEDLTPKNMTCQSPGHNVHELFEHGEEKGRKKAGGGTHPVMKQVDIIS